MYQHLNLEEEVKTRRRRSRRDIQTVHLPRTSAHRALVHCLKDKESECFMPDWKQRQQFQTICIQHLHSLSLHLSVSVSGLILKHNPFGARHVIIFLSCLLLPTQDNFRWLRVVWECFISTSQTVGSDESLYFDSVQKKTTPTERWRDTFLKTPASPFSFCGFKIKQDSEVKTGPDCVIVFTRNLAPLRIVWEPANNYYF